MACTVGFRHGLFTVEEKPCQEALSHILDLSADRPGIVLRDLKITNWIGTFLPEKKEQDFSRISAIEAECLIQCAMKGKTIKDLKSCEKACDQFMEFRNSLFYRLK